MADEKKPHNNTTAIEYHRQRTNAIEQHYWKRHTKLIHLLRPLTNKKKGDSK